MADRKAGSTPGAVLWRLLRNAGIVLRDLFLLPFALRVPRDWVVVRLDQGLVDAAQLPGWLATLRPQARALADVLDVLERARGDERVRGVLLRVGRAPLGFAKLAGVVRAVSRLRESGKRCVVWAERTGNGGAWLGAAADHFWMTPEGSLDLIGVRVDSPFLREALDRFGVHPEVVHAGRFKSAGEMVERSGPSDEAREALTDVVDSLYGALVEGLAARCGGTEEAARRIDEGPYLASEALEAGLVDTLLYGDELPRRLAILGGAPPSEDGPPPPRLLPDQVYLRLSRPSFALEPLATGSPKLAVVPVQGLIRSPERSARPLVAALRRVGEAPDVKAVVLRIDSPGGDPLASDLIWRAVDQLRQEKPVVASLGDTAASGGYYVAMAANEIVAEATTLTGSIGVVLVGLAFDELLGSLGVRFEGVARGRHAGIYDPYRRRSDDELSLLARQVDRIYKSFVEKAARGRGRDTDEIEKVAQGRVWTGAQAVENGLVDVLGGLGTALERARSLAGLGAGEGEPVFLSTQLPLLQRLRGVEALGASSLLEGLTGVQLLCPIEVPLR